MSLNVLIAICVLACDFLIYAFFKWTFGEKYREFRRPLPKRARPPRPASLPNSTKKNAFEIAAARPHMAATRARYRQTEREVA
jgi:hypothetical protein